MRVQLASLEKTFPSLKQTNFDGAGVLAGEAGRAEGMEGVRCVSPELEFYLFIS